jgi:glycosyltransferase involved in cell wall biosynthesis
VNILVISAELPALGAGGGAGRTYELLDRLASRHHITLLTAAGPEDRAAGRLRSLNRLEVIAVDRPAPASGPPRSRWYWRARNFSRLLWESPPCFARFTPLEASFRAKLLALRDRPFDVVQVEHTEIAPWVSAAPPAPRVLVSHNVLSAMAFSEAGLASAPTSRLLSLAEARRVRRREAGLLSLFQTLVAVSEDDAARLRRLCPAVPAAVVPNGVDTGYFRPRAQAAPSKPTVVFTGSMNHPPNADAAVFFCREILPLLRHRLPSVEVWLVGHTPPAAVAALADQPGVIVTGRVADVRPFLARAGAVIVPLRFGSGTRLKILEALAMSRPVVSTTIGAEGLNASPGRHLLVADGPGDFAAETLRLLSHPALAAALGRQGREWVEANYDWCRIAPLMDQVYAGLCPRDSARSASSSFRRPPLGHSAIDPAGAASREERRR